MKTIFPSSLVACIAEGRPPQAAEIEELTRSIERQAFGARPAHTAKRLAGLVADVAFRGTRLLR
jgi:hypothetical protein